LGGVVIQLSSEGMRASDIFCCSAVWVGAEDAAAVAAVDGLLLFFPKALLIADPTTPATAVSNIPPIVKTPPKLFSN
jgi:hypothetical protein